jgi:hypothetical protein
VLANQGRFDTTLGQGRGHGKSDEAAADDNYLAAQLGCSCSIETAASGVS